MTRRNMALNVFVYPGGHHEAGWRYNRESSTQEFDIAFLKRLAQKAEHAKLDALFFADGPALVDDIAHAPRFRLEPLTVLSAISSVTEKIGLIATASTTYYEPYNLARLFGSLDLVSGGRAGWNIVTTYAKDASANFGREDHPDYQKRYTKGAEFVEVVTKLWDSWERDAVISNPEAGIYADRNKIKAINHDGTHFHVRGPLNFPRSPQGRPVYVQAGSSEEGKAFAARYAEVIFTAHQEIDTARSFYQDINSRARTNGRGNHSVRILPGLSPIIGSTVSEALQIQAELNALIQPEYSINQLRIITGIDLSGHDIDSPFPMDPLHEAAKTNASSRFALVSKFIRREKPTIRTVIERLAGARGHLVVAGTPESIADEMQHWFETGAADGFNIMPPWFPGGLDDFIGTVVPILKARGVFRSEYTGRTLREHYDLPPFDPSQGKSGTA